MLEAPSGATRRLYVADAFFARAAGLSLLGRVAGGDGLLIPRCRSVHTIGMRFVLDIAFTSWPAGEGRRVRLLAVHARVPPSRLARLPAAAPIREAGRATAAVELPAGDAVRLGLALEASLILRASPG